MCSTRRGQLANARKTKLTQIPVECFSDVQMPDPRENVANLTEMANFIKENGAEDFKVYSDTMCAIYRGVSCLPRLFWAPQLSCLSCSGACRVYRGDTVTANRLNLFCGMTFCLSTFYKCNSCTPHILNGKPCVHCPRAILSLGSPCRVDYCRIPYNSGVFSMKRSCSCISCFACVVFCFLQGRALDVHHFIFV